MAALDRYQTLYPQEQDTVDRFRNLLRDHARCFERDCWAGHITGSAWLLDPTLQQVLLTHHRKLNIWVQLGGHSDGDANTPGVALREGQEESGLAVELLNEEILDLDIHEIPARKNDPAHYHFDVRYAMCAAAVEFVVSDESHQLAWVQLANIEDYSQERSVLRMREKWLKRISGVG